MAALIPGEKCGVCLDKKTVLLLTNAAGYHPGLVMPSATDGASLRGKILIMNQKLLTWHSRVPPRKLTVDD